MIALLPILVAASAAWMNDPPSPTPTPSPQAPAAPASDPNADAFTARLESIDARIAQVKDLRADFRQTKHSPMLKKPLVSTGVLTLKGDKSRWDTTTPRASTVAIANGELRLYDPLEKVVEIFQATGGLRELTGSPLPRLATLRALFHIAPMDASALNTPPDDARWLGVQLSPATDELKRAVASVRVVIDSSVPCIAKMEITDPDGDRTLLELSNIRPNTGVKDEEAELRYPPGTRESRPAQASAPPAPTLKDPVK